MPTSEHTPLAGVVPPREDDAIFLEDVLQCSRLPSVQWIARAKTNRRTAQEISPTTIVVQCPWKDSAHVLADELVFECVCDGDVHDVDLVRQRRLCHIFFGEGTMCVAFIGDYCRS